MQSICCKHSLPKFCDSMHLEVVSASHPVVVVLSVWSYNFLLWCRQLSQYRSLVNAL